LKNAGISQINAENAGLPGNENCNLAKMAGANENSAKNETGVGTYLAVDLV